MKALQDMTLSINGWYVQVAAIFVFSLNARYFWLKTQGVIKQFGSLYYMTLGILSALFTFFVEFERGSKLQLGLILVWLSMPVFGLILIASSRITSPLQSPPHVRIRIYFCAAWSAMVAGYVVRHVGNDEYSLRAAGIVTILGLCACIGVFLMWLGARFKQS